MDPPSLWNPHGSNAGVCCGDFISQIACGQYLTLVFNTVLESNIHITMTALFTGAPCIRKSSQKGTEI